MNKRNCFYFYILLDCRGAVASVQDSYMDDLSLIPRPISCCIIVITEVGTLLSTTCYLTCTCVCQSCVYKRVMTVGLFIAHSHLARLPQGLTAYGIYGHDIKIARLVFLRHLYSHSIRHPSGNLITVL